MSSDLPAVPRAELLLGGQKSGKSRAAESRARAWLAGPGHAATLVATAIAGDDEMAARIARHRADRAARVPGLRTDEAPHALPEAIARWSSPTHLVVVDCLTLWLTQLAMPPAAAGAHPSPGTVEAACGLLVAAVRRAAGPVVLVSNEIGFGVSPMSAEARAVVDALGRLHQDLATVCDRVTLVVAGCELAVKRTGDERSPA